MGTAPRPEARDGVSPAPTRGPDPPHEAPERGIAAILSALSDALHGAEFEGWYTGPAWDLPITGGGPDEVGPAGKKVAVLRRVPGRGAVHLGHLFVLAGSQGMSLRPGNEAIPLPPGGTREKEREVADLPPSVGARLLVRPTSEATSAELDWLVNALLGRLRATSGEGSS